MDTFGFGGVPGPGIRQLLRGRDDTETGSKDLKNLRQEDRDVRAGAVGDNIGRRARQRFSQSGCDREAEGAPEADEFSDVTPNLGGVDIHCADKRESRAFGDVTRNGGANGAQSKLNHTY